MVNYSNHLTMELGDLGCGDENRSSFILIIDFLPSSTKMIPAIVPTDCQDSDFITRTISAVQEL
jgi:hypothetical protein